MTCIIKYRVHSTSTEHQENVYHQELKKAESFLESCIREINEYWSDAKNSAGNYEMSTLQIIERLCSKFHIVVRQLRSRRQKRPTIEVQDEYDVQDLFHGLLRVFFDDIRPEEWTPSYAGKSSRMDFLLKDHSTVIETKMTRPGLGSKEIGTQLIDDIARYKTHPDCKTLICFVYDPEGNINNPAGIENDLSRDENGLFVKVLIRPSGN